MTYKCKRCGKTSITQKGLHCFRCDHEEAQAAGTTVIYSTPPGYNEITEIKTVRIAVVLPAAGEVLAEVA